MLLSSPVYTASSTGLECEAQSWSLVLVARSVAVLSFEFLPNKPGTAGNSSFHSLVG